MSAIEARPSDSNPIKPMVVFGVLGLVLALRLAHLSSALVSPLSYQPGPDEEYYLRFGQAVLAGQGQDAAVFTFMDPAYGYLLGAIFKLIGVAPVAIYLLQCVLDASTALGIFFIGRLLGRPRAGVYGALLYGLTSTAIMFCQRHEARQKTQKFSASTEIPVNRSLVEESVFLPVLKVLPTPAAWLLAMGIAGLIWLALDDRRWLILVNQVGAQP